MELPEDHDPLEPRHCTVEHFDLKAGSIKQKHVSISYNMNS